MTSSLTREPVLDEHLAKHVQCDWRFVRVHYLACERDGVLGKLASQRLDKRLHPRVHQGTEP
jgi:hypothetical protein